MIGMKPGETKDLNLKFPDDYPNSKDLAGKAAVFTVTLNYISKTNTPKLTYKGKPLVRRERCTNPDTDRQAGF